MKIPKLTPLSFNHYALIFFVIIVGIILVQGFYALRSIDSAKENISLQNYRSAQQELSQKINSIKENTRKIASSLSTWDELFQQLNNPAYYPYWRSHRLMQSGELPTYIDAAEVFNTSGEALADLKESQFPKFMPAYQQNYYIELSKNSAHLTAFLPIKRHAKDTPIKGFLGVKIPIFEILQNNIQFKYIHNIKLITSNKLDHQIIKLSDFNNFIEIELKPNNVALHFSQIVKNTILQLAFTLASFYVVYYLLTILFLGKPLVILSKHIDQLRSNNSVDINTIDPFWISELDKMRTSLNQYHLDLESAKTKLDTKNQELWQLAHQDTLTSILNRRAFEADWENAKNLLKDNRINIGLILFDINRFKAINDSYGHQTGDEVLLRISSTIQSSLRKGEKLYRIGGDEFVTIIFGHSKKQAHILAERCVSNVSKLSFEDTGIKENVSISCGIALAEDHNLETLNNLQWQADIAVYQAKRPNGDNPVIFDESMTDGSESVFSSWMSDAVYTAIKHGNGVEMHYQPIVDIATQITVYSEALLRIKHNDEWIPPSHIFPIIAQRNLEKELDQCVIKHVVADLANQFIPLNQGVAINLSAESVVDAELSKWLEPLIKFTQQHTITLEVTETSFISQISKATQNLKALRELGFKIALDDFGSGYSSLRYLTSLPVDTIKFDLTLIQGMQEKRFRKLVKEIAKLLQNLGYNLVAEGIENHKILHYVQKAGFQYAQGFMFGKPERHS